MARIEVQGIVSAEDNQPLVQFRQVDDKENEVVRFQLPPMESRELAHAIIEAAANAIYEGALIAWAIEKGSPEMGVQLIDVIRKFRSDHWGIPNRPEDWKKE